MLPDLTAKIKIGKKSRTAATSDGQIPEDAPKLYFCCLELSKCISLGNNIVPGNNIVTVKVFTSLILNYQ